MTTDTLDLPTITDPVPAVEPALPAPADLKKVDLQAVALAQFGDWRADVAAARKNLSTLALDLSIPARIAEAKTLRQRLIGTPRAEMRKVATALKSRLAQVSKAVGAEADSAVAAYDDAETLITPQIDAAEQRIEAERLERERAEEQRIAGLKLAVDATFDPWINQCNVDGMTADRVQAGMDALDELAMPPKFADVAAYWPERKAATRAYMERRRLALAAAEVEAARAKARAEQERVSGIQQRIAEIQAAATGHDKASSASLAEARMAVGALAITADIYAEYLPLAQAARSMTLQVLDTLHAAAVAREAAEAQRLAQIQIDLAATVTTQDQPLEVMAQHAQEGVAENPLQPEPSVESSGGDLAAVSMAEVEDAATSDEAPAASVILVESDANATWGAALRGDGTQEPPAGVPLIRGELGTIDAGFRIIGNPPFSSPASEPTMTLGDLNAWLSPLRIDGAGLELLGFPAAGRRKAAMLYHDTDRPAMVAAMVEHLQGL